MWWKSHPIYLDIYTPNNNCLFYVGPSIVQTSFFTIKYIYIQIQTTNMSLTALVPILLLINLALAVLGVDYYQPYSVKNHTCLKN